MFYRTYPVLKREYIFKNRSILVDLSKIIKQVRGPFIRLTTTSKQLRGQIFLEIPGTGTVSMS